MSLGSGPRLASPLQSPAGGVNVDAGRPRISGVHPHLNASGELEIGFNVGWRRSWRDLPGAPRGSWDAAWIFVKYRKRVDVNVAQPGGTDAGGDVRKALNRGAAEPLQRLARGRLAALLSGPLRVKAVEHDARWRVEREIGRGSAPGLQGPIVEEVSATWLDSGALRVSQWGPWQHLPLSPRDDDHRPAQGSEVDAAADGAGVFLRRGARNLGEGDVQFDGVWLRSAISLGSEELEQMELRVFAIQMVYVAESPFALGDPLGAANGAPVACFYDGGRTSGPRTYAVESEAEIQVGPKALYYQNNSPIGSPGDQDGPIPAAFPKGFGAFYVMKDQISQGEWVDFVNTLTTNQFLVRFQFSYGEYRYTPFMTQSGVVVAVRPSRVCNWLAWGDAAAFAAWAGLRPLTELEFEKACRGPLPAVTNELAWGSTTAYQAQIIYGDEGGLELANGNCAYGGFCYIGGDGGYGPLRGDAFDAALLGIPFGDGWASRRLRTGASYCGATGMSGNLWEYCVSAGNPEGRQFTGQHGNGELTPEGNADTRALRWPGQDARGVAFRGGTWFVSPSSRLAVADRTGGSGVNGFIYRSFDTGFRCARTAPAPAPAPAPAERVSG